MGEPLSPESFLKVFADQFEESGRKLISLKSNFKQLPGWSSLQALMVTLAVHETWGVSFSDEEIRKSATVNDLFIITQQKHS